MAYRSIADGIVVLKDGDLEALYKSKGKWVAISLGCGTDKGYVNCALCTDYVGDCSIKNNVGCPISLYTGFTNCADTPYSRFIHISRTETFGTDVRIEGHYAHNDNAKYAASEMADFIQEVIDNVEIRK